MDPYFLIVAILSLGSAVIFSYLTRGIQYFSTDTDNEKQVYAAAQAYKWRWPSDVHKYGMGKTQMKDVTIMLIAFFQKLLGDKHTEHPLTTMCGFANAASAILLFLIARNYWSSPVALVVSLLFLFSAWVWQVALFGGHIVDATTIFLLSVYLAQHAAFVNSPVTWWWLGAAGAAFSLTMFASASARKYIILFLAAVFYAKYQPILVKHDYDMLTRALKENHTMIINIILPLATVSLLAALKIGHKKLVTLMYEEQLPAFINKIIVSRGKFTLEHYIDHARGRVRVVIKKAAAILIGILIAVNAIGLDFLIPTVIGFFAVVLLFTAPNFGYNLKNYFKYYYLAQTKGHFRIYVDYFSRLGMPIERSMRGAGWIWVVKFFWRVAPVQTVIFYTSVVYLFITSLQREDSAGWVTLALLIALKLSPTAWGEFTKGPQLGRSYLPGLISMQLVTGFALLRLLARTPMWMEAVVIALVIAAVWNVWEFTRDAYPARMTSTFLIRKLKELGIKKFYTYKTPYNDAFINNVDPAILNSYEIIPMQSLSEVPGGEYALIPGTSSKALNVESVMEAVQQGDFAKDPVLNEMLETKKIEQYALVRFKTFGTSRFWGHESEVTSYRDLILHEIGEKDLWRGYGWILRMPKQRSLIIDH